MSLYAIFEKGAAGAADGVAAESTHAPSATASPSSSSSTAASASGSLPGGAAAAAGGAATAGAAPGWTAASRLLAPIRRKPAATPAALHPKPVRPPPSSSAAAAPNTPSPAPHLSSSSSSSYTSSSSSSSFTPTPTITFAAEGYKPAVSAPVVGAPKRRTEDYNPDKPNDYEDVKAELKRRRRERRDRLAHDADRDAVPDDDLDADGGDNAADSAAAFGRPNEGDDDDDDDDVDGVPLVRAHTNGGARVDANDAAAANADDNSDDEDLDGVPLSRTAESDAAASGGPHHHRPLPSHANPTAPAAPAPAAPAAPVRAGATAVLLLKNLVGRGQVDDDLEAETTHECSRHGPVVRCLVFEVADDAVPDDEAVRVFVRFRRVEDADSAQRAMDGRFFGGRRVSATFFDEARFAKYDLA
ncbi:hypothetical protein DFJ73DRAFT_966167 [Zopfochytrium polystomum]|nr:hypothetical protein DFJ73DRAFT_966167 [Zopfochytrium polystomum]